MIDPSKEDKVEKVDSDHPVKVGGWCLPSGCSRSIAFNPSQGRMKRCIRAKKGCVKMVLGHELPVSKVEG